MQLLQHQYTTLVATVTVFDNSKPETFPAWIKRYSSITSTFGWPDDVKIRGLQMVLMGRALDIYQILNLNEPVSQNTLSFAVASQMLVAQFIPAGQTQFYADKFYNRTMSKDESVQDFVQTNIEQNRADIIMDPDVLHLDDQQKPLQPSYALGAVRKIGNLRRCNIIGTIENRSESILVDSGATITMCDYDFFKSFQTEDLKVHNTTLTVYSLTDHEIDVVGAVPMFIGIGNKKFGHCVYLIRNAPSKVILGCDFLSKHRINLLFSQNTVQIYNQIVPMQPNGETPKFIHHVAIISQTLTVPPHSTRMATIRLRERSIANLHNGQCRIPVFNASSKFLSISSGSILTQGESVKSDSIQSLGQLAKHLRRGVKLIHKHQSRNNEAFTAIEKPTVTLVDFIRILKLDKQLKHLTVKHRNKLAHVLTNHLDVFAIDDNSLGCTNVIEHEVNTGDHAPIAQRPRRLPFQHREFVKKLTQELLNKNIIVHSCSPWASPIVLVPKKDGTIRFCIDFRAVNKITVPDEYPLPHQQDLFNTLGEAVIFSKLDLVADASYTGLGAILSQKEEGIERIIAYASRSLNPAEKNYAVTELEALAVVCAVKRFKHFLSSTKFTIVTDHRPLKWLMTTKTENARLIRWARELQSHSFEIEHRPGKLNVLADCLSRLPLKEKDYVNLTSTANLLQLKMKQRRDQHLQFIFDYLEKCKVPNSNRDQNYLKLEHENFVIEKGLLYHLFHQQNPNKRKAIFAQLVIPTELQEQVIQENHDSSISGHLAFYKTLHRIRNKYYWTRMFSIIKSYCEKCIPCLKRKRPVRTPIGPLQSLPVATYPFQFVAVDYMCNLTKTSTGFTSILVFTDYFTRYVEVCATRDQTAQTTAKVFVDLIVTRHAAPSQLLSDRGSTFLSDVVSETCKVLKTKKIFTSSYHPQCDGLVERFNKTLADMLATFCKVNQRDWDQYLKAVAFAYNNSIQDSTLESPFFLLYGRDPVTPLDVALGKTADVADTSPQFLSKLRQAWDLAKDNTQKARQKQRTLYNQRANIKDYQVGDKVLLQDDVVPQSVTAKLKYRYKGPYRITRQTSPVNLYLENFNGSSVTFNPIVNVNRLRPCP